MPVHIEKHTDKPVIVFHIEGELTMKTMDHIYRESIKFAQEKKEKIYRISEVSKMTSSFAEMMTVARQTMQNMKDDDIDHAVLSDSPLIFVGDNRWARLASDLIPKRAGGDRPTIFSSMDDAYTFIRLEMDKDKNKDEAG